MVATNHWTSARKALEGWEANTGPRVTDEPTLETARALLAWYMIYGQNEKRFKKGDPALGVRHQWVTRGGEEFSDAGRKFPRLLESCLRHSAFG